MTSGGIHVLLKGDWQRVRCTVGLVNRNHLQACRIEVQEGVDGDDFGGAGADDQVDSDGLVWSEDR